MNEIMNDISYTNMREMLKDCFCEVQTKAANNGTSGIPSGFQPLDDLIGGFEKGKLYVIGGRPCMGKEELMLSMIIDIVLESKLPVLLFSTNYMKSDYVQRLLAIHCDIPILHLHHGLLELYEWERLDKGVETLADVPFFIHDSLDLPLNVLIETARNCIREKEIKVIFIDCLQMVEFAKEDKNLSEKIAQIMFSLKQLACLADVPIVVGSMLGRGVEYREGIDGKKPQLMDLANSSYIEGLADVVMMVHRPEYYHIYTDDNGRDLHGKIEIIINKNALRPLGSTFLEYHQKTGIVNMITNRRESFSKPVRLKDFESDNKAVKNLIKTFSLEEELPF